MKATSSKVTAIIGLTLAAAALAPAEAQARDIWGNCTTFNQQYAHGVGRAHAHDHTSGTPVRSFLHSTTKYNRAMSHNAGLDGDKDGIACEKA